MKRALLACLLVLILGLIYLFHSPTAHRVDCGKGFEGYKVLFVYLKDCPHCQAEAQRLERLELAEQTYFVDASLPNCWSIIRAYEAQLIYHWDSNLEGSPPGLLVPAKLCLSTNRTHIGEQSSEELKQFYSACP